MLDTINQNNFTLVLSGGGALGIAHLGVLHDLEKHHIIPSEIVGTSMGGIIGACMAIGLKEEEIYAYMRDFSSMLNWVKFSLLGNAIVDNTKIKNIFNTIFKDKKMSDVKIPLKLIATNLKTGHKRTFTGDDDIYIKDAVLSTMAIPGVFDEHAIENQIYGDGFLCENLGVNEATHTDVLAVDALGENSFESDMPDNFFKTSNVIEMFEKSIRLLMYNQSKTHIKNCDKNIYLIEPDTKTFSTFGFHKHEEIRAQGLGLVN